MLNVKTQIRNPNSEIRNALPVNSKPEIRNSQFYLNSTLNPELSALSPRLSAPLVVTLSYMYVLFLLSSIPGGENGHVMELVSPTVANIAHVPAYGLLALLWIFTLRDHGITEQRSMYVAFLVASAYGALMEVNQVWIPGRFPSAPDVMFNVAGSLIFIWLYWWATRQRIVI